MALLLLWDVKLSSLHAQHHLHCWRWAADVCRQVAVASRRKASKYLGMSSGGTLTPLRMLEAAAALLLLLWAGLLGMSSCTCMPSCQLLCNYLKHIEQPLRASVPVTLCHI